MVFGYTELHFNDRDLLGDVIAELKKRIPAITILHTPVTLVQYPPSSGQQRNARPLEIATGDAQSDHEEGRTQIDASPEDSIILYIGGGSLTLTNLLLTHALYEVRDHTVVSLSRVAHLTHCVGILIRSHNKMLPCRVGANK